MKQSPSTSSPELITRTAGGQSPATKSEGGSPRDVPQPDNGLAAGGPGHPFDSDIVTKLRRWAISTDAVPASDLMDAAADEIVSLRSMVTRSSDASSRAVRLMGDYASQHGFLLGGLEMIARGHTTAERVLAAAKEKYGDV